MSFLYDAHYLIEPLPVLIEKMRKWHDDTLAEVLLQPHFFKRTEGGNSSWLFADLEATAKLLFLASLREYLPESDEFAAIFGQACISVSIFDQWFQLRRLLLDDDLEVLEEGLRACSFPVEETGRPIVDWWLRDIRPQQGW
jgi:hypothetical protein